MTGRLGGKVALVVGGGQTPGETVEVGGEVLRAAEGSHHVRSQALDGDQHDH